MYTTFMVPWNAMELKLDGTSKIVLRPSPMRLIDTFFKVAQLLSIICSLLRNMLKVLDMAESNVMLNVC